jgi:hypothetical protein
MTSNARLVEGGWIIEGKGVFFTNYGHGETATVDDQIMLGVNLTLVLPR